MGKQSPIRSRPKSLPGSERVVAVICHDFRFPSARHATATLSNGDASSEGDTPGAGLPDTIKEP